ncbi:zinc dependent phospholipase C family protein [Thalassobacillus hwangdonensis]|uniref:Zinc dependent phospholipase C family protein n=1 Tax=Thalassobacillus hwangdonensis TaxID=546108 RepID=A0ABW3L4I4_9BACI
MNTLHHGFWTYFFIRKKQFVKYFIVGSVFPDLVYYVMFFFIFFKRKAWELLADAPPGYVLHQLVHEMFDNHAVIILRQAGHSIFVWGVVFLIILIWKGRKLTAWHALLYGWFGHIIVDLLTHVEDAVPVFYPVSSLVIRGPVSYWDDDHYGDIFSIVNGVLIASTILYLIGKKLLDLRKRRRN